MLRYYSYLMKEKACELEEILLYEFTNKQA
jgi:hypothetical protein